MPTFRVVPLKEVRQRRHLLRGDGVVVLDVHDHAGLPKERVDVPGLAAEGHVKVEGRLPVERGGLAGR